MLPPNVDPKLAAAAARFMQQVEQIWKKQKFDQSEVRDENEAFEKLRGRLQSALAAYSQNPFQIAFLHKASELLDDYRALTLDKLRRYNVDRALSNQVYLAAQAKRSHFASYLAGKCASDDEIDGACKATMHNAAADGAISLFQALTAIYQALPERTKERKLPDIEQGELATIFDVLGMYAEAAYQDAVMLLDRAHDYFPNGAVTLYNRARLEAYVAKTPQDWQHCAATLRSLSSQGRLDRSAKDFHPVFISWHIDNHQSFMEKDGWLRRKITENLGKDEVVEISQMLKSSADPARRILDKHGHEGLWSDWEAGKSGRTRGRVLITTTVVGALLSSAVALAGSQFQEVNEMLAFLHSLFTSQAELTNAAIEHQSNLPNYIQVATLDFGGGGVLRATIGGGGVL